MSNMIFVLREARTFTSNLPRMAIALLLACMPFLTEAQISNADAQALLQQHNQARAQVGTPALCLNQQLMNAAEQHCQDMATHNFFDHTGSDGSDIGARILRAGYYPLSGAENIAWGQLNVAEVVADWKGSTGHYNNMVSGAFQEVGFARCGANLWVTDFASPASGRTNCTTTGTNPTPQPTSAPTATRPDAGLVVHNACMKYVDTWRYFPSYNLYRIYYKNSCYQFDGKTGKMYIQKLNPQGLWRWYPAQ